MKFLSAIFDFMFAPAGAFDPESSHHCVDDDTSHFSAGAGDDSHFSEPSIIHSSGMTINPATCLPMIEDSGIDIMGSPYGFDIHHTDSFICDVPAFTHDCGSNFDNDVHSFDYGSSFDSFSSYNCGSMFD